MKPGDLAAFVNHIFFFFITTKLIFLVVSDRVVKVPISLACPFVEPDQSSPCPSSHFLKLFPGYCFKWTWPIQAPYIPHTKSHVSFPLPRLNQRISPGLRYIYLFRNKANFYGDELLAPCSTPKLEVHTLLAVCNCLFNIFTATIHIGGCSSIRNQRMHNAMVTRTHLSWTQFI